MNNFQYFRCHTMTFVPSRGRIYSFGLGGSGQLGWKFTSNSHSPQLVNGPWLSNNNSTNGEVAANLHSQDNVMQVDEEDSLLPPAARWKQVFVRKIFCGGDQSFSLIGPYTVQFAFLYFFLYHLF